MPSAMPTPSTSLVAAITANVRNRELLRVQLAWVASITGFWCASVGFAVVAYQRDGAAGLSGMGLARFLVPALIGPLAGAVGDRFPRIRVMVVADLSRSLLLLTLLIPTVMAVSWPLYLVAAAVCGLQAVFRPAQAAVIPALTARDSELEAANLISTTAEGVGIFAGPAIGGLLVGFLGPDAVFLFTAATLVASATLVARIRLAAGGPAPRQGGVLRLFREGSRTVAHDRRLRLVMVVYGAQTLVAGALQSLIVVLAFRQLQLGSRGVGLLVSLAGAGALIGGGGVALGVRAGMARVFLVGVALCGVPLALVAALPNLAVAGTAMVAIGIGATMADVGGVTILQRLAPPEMRARVFGILETVLLGSLALGASAAPPVVDLLSLRFSLLLIGLLLPALIAAVWIPVTRIRYGAASADAFS